MSFQNHNAVTERAGSQAVRVHTSQSWIHFICLLVFTALFATGAAFAQAGDGSIEGTILDTTGAAIPGATVVALNINTGVTTTRTSTSAGFVSIGPIIPGKYTVTVTAKGFETYKQQSITIDASHVTGLNIKLTTGAVTDTVTVTDAPPALETTNATLGGTIENEVYTALPITISGLQQRDVTQFSNLLPGAQVPPGGRSSIIGGTAQRLGELYLDGLPLTTISQQGDNRPVFNIVPLEAIDSIQVVTSGFSAQYQGAGLENYSTKSGGNKYHGSVFEYIRNTAFDAWSFSAKPGGPNVTKTVDPVTGIVSTVAGPKTAEHQNEYGFTIGGPISIPKLFNGHDKVFFFATLDKFHSSQGANNTSSTVPTTLMRKGNFQELCTNDGTVNTTGCLGNTSSVNYKVYDPTSQAACTAFNGTPCRYQYGFTHGATAGSAPVPNGQPINVIPSSQISPISQYLEQFLPAPSTSSVGGVPVITNNYVGGIPAGYRNWIYSGRIDWAVSSKHRLSWLVTGGNRHAIPYTATTLNLPVPYLGSTQSTVAGHYASMEDTYTFNDHLVNQFKYGFMNFGGPPVTNPTSGIAQYEATTAGITGLPSGQASMNFPGVTFGGTNQPTGWNVTATNGAVAGSTSVSETYTAVDNLQWTLKNHALTFGFQYQWLENNASTADSGSLPIILGYGTNETANLSGTSYTANTGYSYASYILGAVGSSSVTQQNFSVLGGRYHPLAPYIQDDWKVNSKLTLNIGLRWDYFPTYNEVLNRMSFLNPNGVNPITGNNGVLEFAGNYGGPGVSCNCRTPVNNWYKNFGPRLGFAYSPDPKTVFRGAYAILYSHGGGTGGAGNAGTGTGQSGFNSAASFADNTSGAAFYLNNNSGFSNQNTNFGGPGYVLPPVAGISAASTSLGTGYYVNGAAFSGTGTSITYADPYLGGRAPEFGFFNLGMQREVIKDLTVTVNYVGTQSHFLTGAANQRGLQSGQLNPIYLQTVGTVNCGTTVFSSCLTAAATPANIAKVTAAGYNLPIPYAQYTAAASLSASATIAHMLTWMPQYAGTSDIWAPVANSNYNAFQLTVDKRFTHGLSMTVNYTYSRNIDDAGTARSGWAIPSNATSDGRSWSPDRIDRSLSINNLPQALTIFGVYRLPFGKDGIGATHRSVRVLAGGWQLSEIYQYSSGLPLAITATCGTIQNVGQGTCEPDFNPNFHGQVRTADKWGAGATAANLATKSYLNGYINTANPTTATGAASSLGVGGVACTASTGPFCNSQNLSIGNATRVAPYGLRGPDVYRLAMSVSRTFDVYERLKFVFRVDCQNVTNHTTFGNNAQNNQINLNVNSSAFGTLNYASADARAFQFSGRFNF